MVFIKAELLQLNRTQFSLLKKLQIEKTKTTSIISVLKVVKFVVLVSSISNFFTNKNSQRRKLSAKKIPSFGNSALTSQLSLK